MSKRKLDELNDSNDDEVTMKDLEQEGIEDDLDIHLAAPRKYHYAMVCSSNMNRSMEAHKVLAKAGLKVSSYGVGNKVRLPSKKGQLVFPFGTPYKDIRDAMVEDDEDAEFYRSHGLLTMIERNVRIKLAPERWQDVENISGVFDVVFCFEQRVFDLMIDDIQNRSPHEMLPVHLVNLDVPDNYEEAAIGALVSLDFCQKLQNATNLEIELPLIIEEIEKKNKRNMEYMVEYN